MGFPYFLSAQLDGQTRNPATNGWEVFEGGIGLFLNVMVWVTAVVLDFHLLAYEMTQLESHSHIVQTAAMTTLAISAGTIILFTLIGACNGSSFSSTTEEDASFLPPFATSLIVGNLKSTTCFTIILLLTILNLAPESDFSNLVIKLLVTQVVLKMFGTSMALNNQRLKGYGVSENIFPAE